MKKSMHFSASND